MCTKIYYASRTHSQLVQVLHELRKLRIRLNVSTAPELAQDHVCNTPASSAMTKRPLQEDDNDQVQEGSGSARTVSLASRKQLCINEDLRRRPGDIDEACRQMLGGENFAGDTATRTDALCREREASLYASTAPRG